VPEVRGAFYGPEHVALVREIFARSEPQVEEIFRKFARMVRACGPVHMIPQKTRVVFQVRMRFAGAVPRKAHLICHFVLPCRIASKRFYKIETFNPHCHAHYLRVAAEDELDPEVAGWLKEAYAVGEQKYLL
jgi:Domain of unknown function (DUF5655)